MIVAKVSGQHACPETSVINKTTLRNDQEEVRCHSDRSLVSISTGRVDSDVYCDRRVASFTNKAASDNVLPEYVVNANNAVWP